MLTVVVAGAGAEVDAGVEVFATALFWVVLRWGWGAGAGLGGSIIAQGIIIVSHVRSSEADRSMFCLIISSWDTLYFCANHERVSPDATLWDNPDAGRIRRICPGLRLSFVRLFSHLMVSILTEYLLAMLHKFSPQRTSCSIIVRDARVVFPFQLVEVFTCRYESTDCINTVPSQSIDHSGSWKESIIDSSSISKREKLSSFTQPAKLASTG